MGGEGESKNPPFWHVRFEFLINGLARRRPKARKMFFFFFGRKMAVRKLRAGTAETGRGARAQTNDFVKYLRVGIPRRYKVYLLYRENRRRLMFLNALFRWVMRFVDDREKCQKARGPKRLVPNGRIRYKRLGGRHGSIRFLGTW